MNEGPPIADMVTRKGRVPPRGASDSTSSGARGDAAAIRRAEVFVLYEQEGAALYRLALRITGHREDARDAVQECFTRVLESRQSLRQVRRPGAWVRTLLTRAAIDLRRRKYRTVESRLEKALESDALVTNAAAETKATEGEQVQAVRQAMDELSALDRAILLTQAGGSVTTAELGKAVGLSDVAVRHRLSRARRFLKERLGLAQGKARGLPR